MCDSPLQVLVIDVARVTMSIARNALIKATYRGKQMNR